MRNNNAASIAEQDKSLRENRWSKELMVLLILGAPHLFFAAYLD